MCSITVPYVAGIIAIRAPPYGITHIGFIVARPNEHAGISLHPYAMEGLEPKPMKQDVPLLIHCPLIIPRLPEAFHLMLAEMCSLLYQICANHSNRFVCSVFSRLPPPG